MPVFAYGLSGAPLGWTLLGVLVVLVALVVFCLTFDALEASASARSRRMRSRVRAYTGDGSDA